MTDIQVKCHRPDDQDKDRRLEGLGAPGWYKDIDTLIREIEAGTNRYWTTTPQQQSVWIEVKQRPNGRKYLKTTADGVEPNNLLALSKCA
jgi:Protein of unknown function (DUF3892)